MTFGGGGGEHALNAPRSISDVRLSSGGARGTRGCENAIAAELDEPEVEDLEWPSTRHGGRRKAPKDLKPLPADASLTDRLRRANHGGEAFLPARKAGGQLLQLAPELMESGALNEIHMLSFMLLDSALAPSTRKTYARCVKKWFLMRLARKAPMYLQAEDSHEARETALVEFYTFYSVKCNHSVSSMNVYMYAIRSYHKAVGIDLDFATMGRLAGVRKGWARLAGIGTRKMAATREMIVDAITNRGIDLDTWDDCLMSFGLSYNFNLLQRGVESFDTGSGPCPQACVRVEDLIGVVDGGDFSAPLDQVVDELVRLQPKSKASQSGIGEVNNAYADAGGSIACPVALFNRLRRLKPKHFATENGRAYFFTCSSGKVLLKPAVERLLKAAAKRLGFDSDAFTSHSLRAGGATALWHAGYDSLMIQRRERWASDCLRRYIWEGRETARNLTTRMMASRPSLFAANRSRVNAFGRMACENK